jgi:hypothetical protein
VHSHGPGHSVKVPYDSVHATRRESTLEAHDCIVLWIAKQVPVYDSAIVVGDET